LCSRFGNDFRLQEKEIQEVVWDVGGAVLGKDIFFEFKLDDNYTLRVRSQHWFKFKEMVSKLPQKKYRGKFHKLHSELYAICMTEEQLNCLLVYVIRKNYKFDQIAQVTLDRIPVSNLGV